MAKYIESEAFIKKISDKSINPATTFINTVLKGLFEEAPAADVVEVVRCKDCKYYIGYDYCTHDFALNLMRDNDFCSYGERRKEDG